MFYKFIFRFYISCSYIIIGFVYLKLTLCVIVHNEDGCPYTFDMGNKGFEYSKPQICNTLLRENFANPPRNNATNGSSWLWGVPDPKVPFKVMLMYTRNEDTYRVRFHSDPIYQPISELFVEARRISRQGKLGKRIGFFEPELDFVGYCCENSKLQSVFHRTTVTGYPKYYMFLRWVPLGFTGTIIFRANIFATPTDWYVNVTSKRYSMPPPNLRRRLKLRRFTLFNKTFKLQIPPR